MLLLASRGDVKWTVLLFCEALVFNQMPAEAAEILSVTVRLHPNDAETRRMLGMALFHRDIQSVDAALENARCE